LLGVFVAGLVVGGNGSGDGRERWPLREAAAHHLITNLAAGSGLHEVDATDLKVPMSVPTSEKKRNDVE